MPLDGVISAYVVTLIAILAGGLNHPAAILGDS